MDTQWTNLYPDVTALGGLGPAMRRAATLRGCDIGLPPWAADIISIETTRGFIAIDPSTEQRLFRVRVHIPGFSETTAGFSWNIASTDDLDQLVEMVAAWRQGMSVKELKARFEFMDLDEFARAIAAGEPTSLQWSGLLSSEFHRNQWNLLRRLHTDEVLRNAFPSITHGAVRLRLDPLDSTSRQVLVHEVDGERHEVMRVGVHGADWVEVESGGLIPYLRTQLSKH
ncbi:hypothetical protein [Streptomyces sp. NPDC056670]|uniref:hypothetical protein n=1 Tax=Streptomyces sp. NPDC056670 TaxID=3345904 RepID=UPI0036797F84